MNWLDIKSIVIGAIFGGGGIVGLVFAYMRFYIDRVIARREAEHKKQQERQAKRLAVEDEWYHCSGRLFYHIHKFINTGYHNGDFEDAWLKFQAAEEKKKALDREIIVESEMR